MLKWSQDVPPKGLASGKKKKKKKKRRRKKEEIKKENIET
jgi:hypothetical protein